MIRKIFLAGALLFSINAFAQKQSATTAKNANDGYTVNGNIDGLTNGKAYLVRRIAGEQKVDSADIVNGKFIFKDTLSTPVVASLLVVSGENRGRDMVVLEKGVINVSGNAADLRIKTSGTKENDILNQFNAKLFGGNPKWMEEFEAKYVVAREANDTTLLEKYAEEYKEMNEANVKAAEEMIRANSTSFVAPVTLSQNMMSMEIATADELLKLIEKAPVQYPVTSQLRTLLDKKLAVAPGKMAPEISEKDTTGTKDIALSSLKGKYVLLDFWASWCGPCRAENPHVVDAYNKFKDKNFTVYSVSLDKDRDSWIAAIKEDGLAWPYHVSDLKYWQSEASAKYGVQGIPANFLIDPAGKIIATDLRGDDLHKKLEEVLK